MQAVVLEALERQDVWLYMSLEEKTYALVKDDKIFNIIVCTPDIIEQFSQDLEMDSFVELTDENFFNQISRAKIGDWVNGTSFVWSSWTKNEDGSYTPPIEEPTDGRVYEWREEHSNWMAVTPFPSWSWDPVTRLATAPKPAPRTGLYKWNEDDLDWEPAIAPPQDGELYRWNEDTGEWVIVLP